MKKNERTKIGFTKFEEDFHEIPGTRFIEKSGATDMNDNNIIKALECCTSQGGCLECPLYKPEHTGTCVKSVLVNALGLINRQKSKIERLKRYDEQRDIRLHARLTETARTGAIKEFAERLKNRHFFHTDPFVGDYYKMTGDDIDSLVKEMTEGQDENKH